jgi:ferric-dicitrate binding protein FerR (iron transport regulator)
MNTPRYAAAAARLIRQHLPGASVVAADEARGVETIERAMLARKRRRQSVAWAGALSAAAAVAIAATQLRQSSAPASSTVPIAIDVTPSGQGAALARSEGREQLKQRVSIESGQRIDTPANGGASLQLSTGSSMTLSGRSSFRVDSQGATQRFSLQHGELVAHVAKLTTAQRFIVDTPDAEIEVRGTRFRLRVIERPEACGGGTRTRLEVSEGAVEVRLASANTVSVKAGEVWPTDCAEPIHVTQTPAPQSINGHETTIPKTHAVSPIAANETERGSALTAPNDLFAEGVARGRQGDTSGALRIYQELMSRFPTSPLAENALVERMRLSTTIHERAVEAKQYLARYPRGFAAAEARKLLSEP